MNEAKQTYDWLVIGAGIYGLHAALILARQGRRVLVAEYDPEPFQRATFINQARVHLGYHYPRSISTALKSASYFDRFNEEFGFAVNSSFKKVYAVAKNHSLTNAAQFEKFCSRAGIEYSEIDKSAYFNDDTIEGAFETKEYSFDAEAIKKWYLKELGRFPTVEIRYNVRMNEVNVRSDHYEIICESGQPVYADAVINATYASVNQVLRLFGFDPFMLKYELCEVILCDVAKPLHDVGITVMDGPFFSVMPFGLSGLHSLTSVSFTPRLTSQETLPTFPCQALRADCSPESLANCDTCPVQPFTAWSHMSQVSKTYLRPELALTYRKSHFTVKPLMKASEIDDSRPTVIREFSDKPRFISVLSGKINTFYDLDEYLV